MSDDDKDISTDFEEALAKIVSQKARTRHNDDIYERFISRVQIADSDNSSNDNDDSLALESAKKLAAFEPLSAEELQLFEEESSQQAQSLELVDITTTNATFDFSNKNTPVPNKVPTADEPINSNQADSSLRDTASNHHILDDEAEKSLFIDTDEQEALSSSMPISIKSDDDLLNTVDVSADLNTDSIQTSLKSLNKPARRKKPLMVMVVGGLLLIAATILVLVFTGVLATPTPDNTASDDITNSASSSIVSKMTVEDTQASNPNTEQTPTLNDAPSANTTSQSTSAQQATDLNGDQQDAPASSAAAESTELTDSAPPNSEAVITYEDFRQESQTTLYRETND
ncbi:hypothetical protein IP510_08945 [Psychrobacter sp. NG254]|uniref:hypothetical protein n=1 Tax=Psychrobacter sp. NG254 TaxID=2782003 RepID=UPI00188862B9|nr:hypothetical protein [Psychrobacter sp. NG254]MBF2720005.1 hypothetical protein [Psychrobacter sp. NG254]